MVADFGKQTKEDGAEGGDGAADVVTEACPGGAEQGGKERREIHGEEGEGALAKPDQREPAQQAGVVARDAISADYSQKIDEKGRGNRGAIADQTREPAGKEIAKDGGGDDQVHRR